MQLTVIFVLLTLANLYKKYYACIIFYYLLNNIWKHFTDRVFRTFINNIKALDFINSEKKFSFFRLQNLLLLLPKLFFNLTGSQFNFTWQHTRVHFQHIEDKVTDILWLDFPFIFF